MSPRQTTPARATSFSDLTHGGCRRGAPRSVESFFRRSVGQSSHHGASNQGVVEIRPPVELLPPARSLRFELGESALARLSASRASFCRCPAAAPRSSALAPRARADRPGRGSVCEICGGRSGSDRPAAPFAKAGLSHDVVRHFVLFRIGVQFVDGMASEGRCSGRRRPGCSSKSRSASSRATSGALSRLRRR